MRKMIGAMCAALALFATSAAAQPFDDDGLGWGPYYNNHLSPYDGRPLGPPLSSLPPGAEYYNGVQKKSPALSGASHHRATGTPANAAIRGLVPARPPGRSA